MNTTFRIPNATGKLGQTFTAKVRLRAVGTEMAFSFSLKFDPKIVDLNLIEMAALPDGFVLSTNELDKASGVVGILVDGTSALPKRRTYADVLTLTFMALKPGKSELQFAEHPAGESVANIQGALLPVKFIGGMLTVKK